MYSQISGAGMHGGGAAMQGGAMQMHGGMAGGMSPGRAGGMSPGMGGGMVHMQGAGMGQMQSGSIHMTGPRTGMAGSMLPGTAVMSASGNIVGGAGCLGAGALASCMGCGGTCGEETTGSISLLYVGGGGGEWVEETTTTYKYVGAGAGDLIIEVQKKQTFFWGCCGFGVFALVLVAILFWCTPTKTTTQKFVVPTPTLRPTWMTTVPPPTTTTKAVRQVCICWGDPHCLTFDLGRPSFYGEGEFWILKNPQAQIQGRYMGTPFTYGLAAAQKIAIGGPFLQGHTIEVEPMEHAYGGHILVDGEPVLLNFGTYRVGDVATINYDGQGDLPDQAASQWTTRAVHLELPMDIVMTIFRWGNYVDFKLEMSPLPGGQDGSCGNFNGDASDDTTPAIFKRIGARVGRGELLFSHFTDVSFTSEEQSMLNKDCPEGELMAAREKCRGGLLQSATEQQLNACAFDVCFGMNEHALRIAKTYATAEDRAAAHEALA